VKAASAGAVLGARVIAFFSPDKARRRGVGLTARAGLEVGANCGQQKTARGRLMVMG